MAVDLNILRRAPRDTSSEPVLVDRGEGVPHRYVVGTATAHSLAYGEWYWGHYFRTLDEAETFFAQKVTS